MAENKTTGFNDVVSFQNKDAFLHAVDNMLTTFGGIIKADSQDENLDHMEAFFDNEADHLGDLSKKITNWKQNLPEATDAMAELLVIERLARDLRDSVSAISHYPEIKETLGQVRSKLIIEDQAAGGFFDDLCATVNKHLDDKHDYLGHKLEELHLDEVVSSAAPTDEATRNPSEKLSVMAKNSLDHQDMVEGHTEPQVVEPE